MTISAGSANMGHGWYHRIGSHPSQRPSLYIGGRYISIWGGWWPWGWVPDPLKSSISGVVTFPVLPLRKCHFRGMGTKRVMTGHDRSWMCGKGRLRYPPKSHKSQNIPNITKIPLFRQNTIFRTFWGYPQNHRFWGVPPKSMILGVPPWSTPPGVISPDGGWTTISSYSVSVHMTHDP